MRSSLRQLRSALLAVLRDPAATARIADALEELDKLEKMLDARPAGRRALGRGQPKTYRVEPFEDADWLCEYREGDPNPFRCPKAVYDTLAELFTQARRPLKFAELVRAVRRRLSRNVPGYQMRVTLRFWMAIGAVERTRARFQPRGSEPLLGVAERAWAGLRQ